MATLADHQELYKATISNLPIDVRLLYCIKHLDKIQSVLLKNAEILDIQQKEKLKEMIQSTQCEIKQLET
jgi:hypothetical protein